MRGRVFLLDEGRESMNWLPVVLVIVALAGIDLPEMLR